MVQLSSAHGWGPEGNGLGAGLSAAQSKAAGEAHGWLVGHGWGGTVGSKEGSEAGGSQQSAETMLPVSWGLFPSAVPTCSLIPASAWWLPTMQLWPGLCPTAGILALQCPHTRGSPGAPLRGPPMLQPARRRRLSLRCVPGRQVTLSAYLSVHWVSDTGHDYRWGNHVWKLLFMSVDLRVTSQVVFFLSKRKTWHTIYLTRGLLGQTTDSDQSGQVNPQRASSPRRDGQGRRAPQPHIPWLVPEGPVPGGFTFPRSVHELLSHRPHLSPPYLSRLYMETFPAVKLKPKGPLYPTLALIPNPVTPSSSALFVPSVVLPDPPSRSFCLSVDPWRL